MCMHVTSVPCTMHMARSVTQQTLLATDQHPVNGMLQHAVNTWHSCATPVIRALGTSSMPAAALMPVMVVSSVKSWLLVDSSNTISLQHGGCCDAQVSLSDVSPPTAAAAWP
jgi:hypothetical protein